MIERVRSGSHFANGKNANESVRGRRGYKFQFVALLEVDTVGEGLDPPLTFRLQNGLFHVGNTVFAYYIQRDRRYVEGGSRPSPTG